MSLNAVVGTRGSEFGGNVDGVPVGGVEGVG